MRVLLTGGGTGGHFYPLVAVARALKKIAEDEKIPKLELYLAADKLLDPEIIFEERIKWVKIPAGKMRRYFSFRHFGDSLKTIFGIFFAFWKLYLLLPDIVFSKGGYASFPVLVASRILKIPVIIHDSDVVPGLVSQWAGRWTQRIALAFYEAGKYFTNQSNVAVVGNPIRQQVVGGDLAEAIEYFSLEEGLPTILFLGGSQGAEKINETILAVLPEIVKSYQIIHQTGRMHFEDIASRAAVLLGKSEFKSRYHPVAFLGEGELRNASRAASLVVSRASSAIFEIAAWGLPSILIPLPSAAQNHQRENAYVYARAGACEVIEETNLTPHIMLAQISKLLGDKQKMGQMKAAALAFAKPDAAEKIAREIIKLGIHD